MKVYVVEEILCDDVFWDKTFAIKELADEYCEWKNKHQGSKWCRWQCTEIEAITRRLSEAEMQNDYSYSEE